MKNKPAPKHEDTEALELAHRLGASDVEPLVSRFAEFVDGVEHSVDRAEEPQWCAGRLTSQITGERSDSELICLVM